VDTGTVTGDQRPRTQAERSAETQALLLDATIISLVELGYARTSTTEIVRRAGVSRGAQVHHYPTKADLVVAAVERVFGQQEQQFAERFRSLPPGERSVERAIELLWSIFDSPAFQAILELVVASRTDEQLRVVVQAVGARFEQSVADLYAEFFPDLARTPVGSGLVGFAFAVLSGAAMSDYAGFGDPRVTVDLLKALTGIVDPVLEALNDERHD